MALDADEKVDVAIVGAGPCGLAAAVTMLRAQMSCLVFDGGAVTSTITAVSDVRELFFDGREALDRRAAIHDWR